MSEYNFDLMINRIKLLKKEKKITNVMLAEISGIPIGTLNKILGSETKEPSVNAIIKIANALNVTVDELLTGNLEHYPTAYQSDIDDLLHCCCTKERKIVYEIIREIIVVLRNNQ